MQRDLVTDKESITGTFNMIQVGGTFGSDAERLVILDIEDDGYTFDPITGPGRVKNFPGTDAQEALRKTEQFFSDHCAYNGYLVHKLIIRENNQTVGYDIEPYYTAVFCKDANEILVSYGSPVDGVIKVYTSLLLKVNDGGSGPMIGREKSRP